MKSLAEQDHYEILETSPGASPEEIERSYRMALATYADDSLAGYSVFGDGDNQALRDRIEIAFRVLSDRDLRREYDVEIGVATAATRSELGTPSAAAVLEAKLLPERRTVPPSAAATGEFEQLDDGEGDFDGGRLRAYRMRCGLELEDIAAITKVNPSYLRFIEDEQFANLPAAVYVRGFVSAYAACLGLDSKHVAQSYMTRYQPERVAVRRKGRFFEGR